MPLNETGNGKPKDIIMLRPICHVEVIVSRKI